MVGELKQMTILEHLGELRKRLFIALGSATLAVVVAFILQDRVFAILKRPLDLVEGQKAQLVTLSPTEPFMTTLKVSIYAGLLMALPIIMWQLWAFIMPALYENEKKTVLPYVALTTGLFVGGVAFAYFLVLPIGLDWLVGYGGDTFRQDMRAGEYLNFVVLFLLAFGLVFELPVAILSLAAMRIVDTRFLRRKRRHAIVVIAIVSMVITPSQDPVSMLLLVGPLVLLYEISLVLVALMERRRARRSQVVPTQAG